MARVSVGGWSTRSVRLGRAYFAGGVAGVVGGLILLFLISQAHLFPWDALARILPAPWNQVVNPSIGPKMLRLLAAEALAFAAVVGGANLVLRVPGVRAIFGNGSLVVFRRAIGLAWLPILASAYLLTHAGPDHWILTIFVHGDNVILTVPTLAGVVLFGIAALALAPGPSGRYLPLPLEVIADVAPLVVALGVVLSLDLDVSAAPRPWDTHVGNIVIVQLTLATAEIIYVLAAAEAAIADWGDLKRVWQNRRLELIPPGAIYYPTAPDEVEGGFWWRIGRLLRRLILGTGARARATLSESARRLHNLGASLVAEVRAVPAAARFAIRLAIFATPVLVGMWMALGYQLSYASPILDRNGQLLEFYHAGAPFRLYIAPDNISPYLYEAIDATEDPGIYTAPATHSPINPVRVAGIFTAAASSGALSGGSGIATQSCKNLVGRELSDDVWALPAFPLQRQIAMMTTLAQKLAFEFPCGWALERTALFTRPRGWVVALYLNQIYFGQGVYGVRAATQTYFDRAPDQLTLSQATLLAGLPQAPTYYDPWARPEVVQDRREIVVHSMLREGYVTADTARTLDATPLGVLAAPWEPPRLATDFVHNGVADWLDANNFRGLSSDGYTVTTTLDLGAQRELQNDLSGVVQSLASRGVDAGAAMVVDPRTGQIRAWVGTTLDPNSQFQNDLVGGLSHQSGSAIKPLLYSCALYEGKLDPNEKIDDTQRVIDGKYVANWDLKSHGLLTPREALAQSSNVAAATLTARLTPEGFADCLHSVFQIQTDLHPDQYGVFLGIGLAPIPMDQLASAYTILATGGTYHAVVPVAEIRSPSGQVIYQVPPDQGRIILDCSTTLWVTQAMGDVSQIIGLPGSLATKTGTTPSSSFAVGFGRTTLVLAWVGNLANNGVQLSTEDVFGKDGGGQVWKDWAEKHLTAPSAQALNSCPSP